MSQDIPSSAAPAAERDHDAPTPGAALVRQGVFTDEEYASALSRSEQSGHSIWTALRGVVSLILPGRARPRGRAEAGQEPHAAGADPDRGEETIAKQ